ncbi:MAG: class I SAM-dependent methyltransferase [Alphaproteobacteria bacterium]|nr:class I SAM-dependent methyltransferase [Alphaproteobacteria bacterium]
MKHITAHFDSEAYRYPTEIGEDHVQDRKWALIKTHAPKAGIVADIGSASGRHSLKLAARELSVVAIDPSQKMLATLVRGVENTDLNGRILPCASALPHLPFTQARFDLVYCFSTMLLLPQNEQEIAVREMSLMLAPGGILILDVAGTHSLAIRYWRRYYQKRGMDGVFGHTAQGTRSLLGDNGLEIVSMEAHGVLSQFLLFPGLEKIPGLTRLVRGRGAKPGWDAVISRLLPRLAERWYVVTRRPADGTN